MSHYLILLTIIPLACFQLTKILNTKHRWLLCGISVGLVIAPVSFGLLQFTFVPVIGKILGYIGLIANLTHGSIGYFFLVGNGWLEPGITISALQLVLINIVNAILFSYAYGMIGFAIDKKLATEKAAQSFVFTKFN